MYSIFTVITEFINGEYILSNLLAQKLLLYMLNKFGLYISSSSIKKNVTPEVYT